MAKIGFENTFRDKISNFLGPKKFRKNVLRKINENSNFWNFKKYFFKFQKFQFSLIFRRTFFETFLVPTILKFCRETLFSKSIFAMTNLIFLSRFFFLARYGWLLSIPHVYTASLCPCRVSFRKNFQNPLNLYLSGSFREKLQVMSPYPLWSKLPEACHQDVPSTIVNCVCGRR